jgi:hypothetical protein
MGTIFEELIRKFNEQSNENPGEHFTPREVIRLMIRSHRYRAAWMFPCLACSIKASTISGRASVIRVSNPVAISE